MNIQVTLKLQNVQVNLRISNYICFIFGNYLIQNYQFRILFTACGCNHGGPECDGFGTCTKCGPNFTGPKCDQCKVGYYGRNCDSNLLQIFYN